MDEDYVGVIVDPWELEGDFADYTDIAMDHLRTLDRKCLLVEDSSKYGEGEFDIVEYGDFSDYLGDDAAFITGTPDKMQKAAEMAENDSILLDDNILRTDAVDIPSRYQILKEEALSLVPMYEPDRQHVEVTTSEDVLRKLGLEDADLMPLHALQ